jgi:hypothetical protein
MLGEASPPPTGPIPNDPIAFNNPAVDTVFVAALTLNMPLWPDPPVPSIRTAFVLFDPIINWSLARVRVSEASLNIEHDILMSPPPLGPLVAFIVTLRFGEGCIRAIFTPKEVGQLSSPNPNSSLIAGVLLPPVNLNPGILGDLLNAIEPLSIGLLIVGELSVASAATLDAIFTAEAITLPELDIVALIDMRIRSPLILLLLV